MDYGNCLKIRQNNLENRPRQEEKLSMMVRAKRNSE